jgi:hypothetical protein
MTNAGKMTDPDECVVKVQETSKGRTRVFYGIRDECLNYWRSRRSINAWDAWTRDVDRRVEFGSRKRALQELNAIRRRRQEAA